MVLAAFVGVQAMQPSEGPVPMEVERELTDEELARELEQLLEAAEWQERAEAQTKGRAVTSALMTVTKEELEQLYGPMPRPGRVSVGEFMGLQGLRMKHFYERKMRQLDPALVDYFRARALYQLTGKDTPRLARNAIYNAHELAKYQEFINRWLPSYTVFVGNVVQQMPDKKLWQISYRVPAAQIN